MVLLLALCLPAWVQQKPLDDSRLARIEERLTHLEEGQKALGQRINDLRADKNARVAEIDGRFCDLHAGVNARFDDLKSKFGWLYILLSAIIALNGAIVGSVVWLARQDRPISQRHYDEIVDRELEFKREMDNIKL